MPVSTKPSYSRMSLFFLLILFCFSLVSCNQYIDAMIINQGFKFPSNDRIIDPEQYMRYKTSHKPLKKLLDEMFIKYLRTNLFNTASFTNWVLKSLRGSVKYPNMEQKTCPLFFNEYELISFFNTDEVTKKKVQKVFAKRTFKNTLSVC